MRTSIILGHVVFSCAFLFAKGGYDHEKIKKAAAAIEKERPTAAEKKKSALERDVEYLAGQLGHDDFHRRIVADGILEQEHLTDPKRAKETLAILKRVRSSGDDNLERNRRINRLVRGLEFSDAYKVGMKNRLYDENSRRLRNVGREVDALLSSAWDTFRQKEEIAKKQGAKNPWDQKGYEALAKQLLVAKGYKITVEDPQGFLKVLEKDGVYYGLDASHVGRLGSLREMEKKGQEFEAKKQFLTPENFSRAWFAVNRPDFKPIPIGELSYDAVFRPEQGDSSTISLKFFNLDKKGRDYVWSFIGKPPEHELVGYQGVGTKGIDTYDGVFQPVRKR